MRSGSATDLGTDRRAIRRFWLGLLLLAAGCATRGDLSAPSGAPSPRALLAGPTEVPIQLWQNVAVIYATLNGSSGALLIVDTGSVVTILTPSMVSRLGLSIPDDTLRRQVNVLGGQTIDVSFIRLASIQVGAALVEDLEVGVAQILPGTTTIDGLLGGNFLQQFRFTFDRTKRQMRLEPLAAVRQPASPPPRPSAEPPPPPGRPSPAPVWQRGEEWAFRWESPRGKGTFVRSVDREEAVEGAEYYVLKSGTTRETYWRKSDLAYYMEKVEGAVESRYTPPFTYYVWPLAAGNTWEFRSTHERPMDRQTNEVVRACRVEAEEDITVPAGTFRTFKVVCRDPRTGSITTDLWYSPEIKNAVWLRRHFSWGIEDQELIAFKLK